MRMNSNEEIWRDIEGFSMYQISNRGRVKSFCQDRRDGRIMSTRSKKLYDAVRLHSDGGARPTKYVHTLVAEAFIGPRPRGLICHHIDGDFRNNTPENLFYAPRSHSARKWMHIRGYDRTGESNSQAKLTREQVLLIRELAYQGGDAHSLAEQFKVSTSAIRRIISRRSWKYVK